MSQPFASAARFGALALLIFAVVTFVQAQYEPPVFETNDGTIQGLVQYTLFQRKPYYAFKGIPFAQPPIGHLRFKVSIINQELYLLKI